MPVTTTRLDIFYPFYIFAAILAAFAAAGLVSASREHSPCILAHYRISSRSLQSKGGAMLREEVGICLTTLEDLVLEQLEVKGNRGWYTFQHIFVQGSPTTRNRIIPCRRPDDELGQ